MAQITLNFVGILKKDDGTPVGIGDQVRMFPDPNKFAIAPGFHIDGVVFDIEEGPVKPEGQDAFFDGRIYHIDYNELDLPPGAIGLEQCDLIEIRAFTCCDQLREDFEELIDFDPSAIEDQLADHEIRITNNETTIIDLDNRAPDAPALRGMVWRANQDVNFETEWADANFLHRFNNEPGRGATIPMGKQTIGACAVGEKIELFSDGTNFYNMPDACYFKRLGRVVGVYRVGPSHNNDLNDEIRVILSNDGLGMKEWSDSILVYSDPEFTCTEPILYDFGDRMLMAFNRATAGIAIGDIQVYESYNGEQWFQIGVVPFEATATVPFHPTVRFTQTGSNMGQLPDGTLVMATWQRSGSAGEPPVHRSGFIKQSFDGGRTWSIRSELRIADGNDEINSECSFAETYDENGDRVWAAMLRLVGPVPIPPGNRFGFFYSYDDMLTWQQQLDVVLPASVYLARKPKLMNLGDRRLIFFYRSNFLGGSLGQSPVFVTSEDGGKNWKWPFHFDHYDRADEQCGVVFTGQNQANILWGSREEGQQGGAGTLSSGNLYVQSICFGPFTGNDKSVGANTYDDLPWASANIIHALTADDLMPGSVAEWVDRAGTANFTQGTPANQPSVTRGVESWFGKPVLAINTDERVISDAAASSYTFLSNGSPFSFCIKMWPHVDAPSDNTNYWAFGTTDQDSTSIGFLFLFDNNASGADFRWRLLIFNGASGEPPVDFRPSGGLDQHPRDNKLNIGIRYDGSLFQVFLDGIRQPWYDSARGVGGFPGQPFSGSDPAQTLFVGTPVGQTLTNPDDDLRFIRSLILSDQAVTDGEMAEFFRFTEG